MDLLVLGGTAWLGGAVVHAALAEGHKVTVMARGQAGPPPSGVRFVRGDRARVDAYPPGRFDAVIDVARDPALVATALDALAERVGHWLFVSSCSVYADQSAPDGDETSAVLPALVGDYRDELYGEAKVRCEDLIRDRLGVDRCFIARSGLIAGTGDITDRTGYWPLRFAHPATDDGSVLVPDAADQPVQWIDVRDLADWLVAAAFAATPGTFDAAGQPVSFVDFLATVRSVVGHTGTMVRAAPSWLEEHEVAAWSGPRSLPIWLPGDHVGMLGRRCERAVTAGLTARPLEQTVADVLAWELRTGPGRLRRAGLSAEDERALIAALS